MSAAGRRSSPSSPRTQSAHATFTCTWRKWGDSHSLTHSGLGARSIKQVPLNIVMAVDMAIIHIGIDINTDINMSTIIHVDTDVNIDIV